ncbi:MAG: hypothetical protein LBS50_08220 [Prevotellaceae bacterium]|jgi:hypothetical protein|nr:hypothetical protein [Prevotellaceae bacterium]
MKQIEQNLEKKVLTIKYQQDLLSLEVNKELDITNSDRALENNLISWAYRLKNQDIFYRREVRGDKVFLIRYK